MTEEQATPVVEDAAETHPVVKRFREACPDIAFTARPTFGDVNLDVPVERFHDLMDAAKHHPSLKMDLLRSISGVDQLEAGLDCVYHLYSVTHGHSVQVTVRVPLENPVLPTVTDIWKGANWHERETAEMFGFVFEGHPDPRHLLLDEDVNIHPLLKAHPLAPIEVLQGVEDDAGFDF